MALQNAAVANALDEFGDLLELLDENAFRVRAYRRAAETVRAQSRELAAMLAAGEDLDALPGIGPDLAQKIRTLVATGTCRELEALRRRVPRGQLELLRLPGLGPKRVRSLRTEQGITTPSQLARALARGVVRGLPRATTASGRRLATAVQARVERPRVPRADAQLAADALVAALSRVPGVSAVTVAGSYRRERPTVGDLDVLVASSAPDAVVDAFCTQDDVAGVIARGRTRAAVELRGGLHVDLRVVPRESWGAALIYFTGSKAHNLHLRRIARDRGLKLNEYGLFRGTKRLAGETEEDVYRALGLAWIPPTAREDCGEIEAAGAPPARARTRAPRGERASS
jgi:DNA polymerase (family 10)